jgi:hypothetical protein
MANTLYLYGLTQCQAPQSKKPKPDPVAIDEFRRDHLPYGIWVTNDGREILFNRDYQPLWERRGGSPPVPAERREDVRAPITKFFYSEGTPDKARRALQALKAWGIDPTSAPIGLVSVCDPVIDINNLRAWDIDLLRERLWQLGIDALRAAMGCAPTMQSTL